MLQKMNISKSQLPKIILSDPALPEGCEIGDLIKIQRKEGDRIFFFYRVVV